MKGGGRGYIIYIRARNMCAQTEAGKSTGRTLKLRIGGIKLRFENLKLRFSVAELRFSEVKLRFIFAELRYGFVMVRLVHLVQRFTVPFASHTRARIIRCESPPLSPHHRSFLTAYPILYKFHFHLRFPTDRISASASAKWKRR